MYISGFSTDNPLCQAEALVDGDGLANCIVLLGDLVKHQDPIKKKRLPTILNLVISKSRTTKSMSNGLVELALAR